MATRRRSQPGRLAGCLGIFVLLLVAGAAWGTTWEKVELACPLCGEKVTGMVIMSTNTFGGTDSDFLQRAVGAQPILITPIVCGNCYYAGHRADFDKEVKLSDDVKKKLRENLKPPVAVKKGGDARDLPPWARYDLIAQHYAITIEKPETIAHCYLCAAWSVRLTAELPQTNLPKVDQEKVDAYAEKIKKQDDESRAQHGVRLGTELSRMLETVPDKDKRIVGLSAIGVLRGYGENALAEDTLKRLGKSMPKKDFQSLEKQLSESIGLERTYQKKALPLFEKLAADKSNQQQAVLMYLCGELHRRLGQPKEALAWYDKALAEKGPDWLPDLAKKQKQLVTPVTPPKAEKPKS